MTPKIIDKCITSLKKNKSDDNKGFNSNHLTYGPPRLKILLSILFNSMLAHGCYPTELLKSNIISIYRKIELLHYQIAITTEEFLYLTVYAKCMIMLLNYVKILFLLVKCNLVSKRTTLPLMCTVILREVIQNYIEGHSNVYCCLLDASKAFDKVHYGKLFTILLARNVSPYVIRLLIDSYVRQQACVS